MNPTNTTEKHRSLRIVLILMFSLQLIVFTGIISWLSFRNSQQTVQEIIGQLQTEITSRIKEHLYQYLAVPPFISKINQDAIENGHLNTNNQLELEHHLFQQIKLFPKMTYISYSTETGNYTGAHRQIDNGLLRMVTVNESTQYTYMTYETDEHGNKTNLVNKTTPIFFDPRKRPWYQQTINKKQRTWYDAYKYVLYDSLGLGFGAPVHNKNGDIIGVLASDLALIDISRFLNSLKIGKTGQAFIIEKNGNLIASSNLNETLATLVDGKIQRFSALQSKSSLINQSTQYLKQHFGDFHQIKTESNFSFEIDKQKNFINVLPYQDDYGLDWLVVVVLPEQDFMAKINVNSEITFFLSLGALLIAIFIAMLFARWITLPLEKMSIAASKIANGDWEQNLEHLDYLRRDEIGELSRSFKKMGDQLKFSFDALEMKNEQLRYNEERLKQFLEAIPLGIFIVDAQGVPYYANQAAQVILRKNTIHDLGGQEISGIFQAYLGKKSTNYLHYQKLPEIYNIYLANTPWLYPVEKMPLTKALNGKAALVDDMEIRHSDCTIPLEVRATPVFNEKREVIFAIAVFQDISLRRQAEQDKIALIQEQEAKNAALKYNKEIGIKNEQLIHLNQEKNELMAIVVHDLKNPLSAIKGLVDIIQWSEESLAKEELAEYVDMIQTSTQQMFDLIENLLDMNKLDSGEVKANVQPTNIWLIILRIIKRYQMKAQVKNITIFTEVTNEKAIAMVDENLFHQVLDNIISNAVKYSPFDKNVYCRMSVLENKVRCEIEDQGPGFSEQDLKKLFGKFSRLSAKPTGGEHSSGLGLFIVKKLVENMHGNVWCETKQGCGAKFIIEFPIFTNTEDFNP
jgi:signal transduction histidine kinase/HAMP domain-containing protein